MDGTVIDRRAAARVSGLSLPSAHATLRPGTPVHIVELSQAGMLIQTDRPLRPCGRAYLRLDAPGHPIGLAAIVVRCAVWTIHPMGGVSYRAALRFEACCPAFWEELALEDTDSSAVQPLEALTDPTELSQVSGGIAGQGRPRVSAASSRNAIARGGASLDG